MVVTRRAADERAADLAPAIVGSFTLGAGQFCTKPGLLVVPAGPAGDVLVDAMRATVSEQEARVLLNAGIAAGYEEGIARLEREGTVEVLAHGRAGTGQGFEAVPLLLGVPAGDLPEPVTEECFGPVAVVVRYSSDAELSATLEALPPSLTATVLRGTQETEVPALVVESLRDRAGRLIFDGFPTGVAVSWAQHHGGPWPSTNSQHTSVGATAVRRFLRPVTWQDAPPELLPAELREDGDDIPRRVDGQLRLPRAR